jgi:hypothetical protein
VLSPIHAFLWLPFSHPFVYQISSSEDVTIIAHNRRIHGDIAKLEK